MTPPESSATPGLAQMRAEFEADMEGEELDFTLYTLPGCENSYRDSRTQLAFFAWRCAWNRRPSPAAPAAEDRSSADAAFLAARLRRLFAHFALPLPKDAAADDARLIGIAGSAIGMLLTRWETFGPDWYAVMSEAAPGINRAIRRADVADEYADKCRRDGYTGVEVIPLYAHADARHAAAELVCAAGSAPEPAWWAGALNRRATVEQWMFDAARGKRPMPTADELRAWAIKLGTPEPGEPAGSRQAEQVWLQAYAALGAFLFDLAERGHPQAEKLMDNLSEARMVHEDVLPFEDVPAGSLQGKISDGDLMELARQYAHAYFNHHSGREDGMLEKTEAKLRAVLCAAGVPADPEDDEGMSRAMLPPLPPVPHWIAEDQIGPFEMALKEYARAAIAGVPAGAAQSGWIPMSERRPERGALIVKRWLPSGSVWAGIYSGTDKDSSFDEWCALPHPSRAAEGREIK